MLIASHMVHIYNALSGLLYTTDKPLLVIILSFLLFVLCLAAALCLSSLLPSFGFFKFSFALAMCEMGRDLTG